MRYSAAFSQLDGFTLLHGRTYYSGGSLALDWSGAGFELSLRCSRAVISFEGTELLPEPDQPTYVIVTCDGRDAKYAISTGKERIILENLEGERHIIRLLRLTEGETGLLVGRLCLDGGTIQINDAPKAKDRRIEFLGDSITCGYGDLSPAGCGDFNYYEEDVTAAYAYKTAQKLDCDGRYVSISGQGIIRNCHGDVGYRIPEFFHHLSRNNRVEMDFARWIPDVVVINAGTNDCGGQVTKTEFEAGARAFIADVRRAYRDAEIVWFYGMMGLQYDGVLRDIELTSGDPKFHYLPIEPIYGFEGEIGANGHPNTAGHDRAAGFLCEFLGELPCFKEK